MAMVLVLFAQIALFKSVCAVRKVFSFVFDDKCPPIFEYGNEIGVKEISRCFEPERCKFLASQIPHPI